MRNELLKNTDRRVISIVNQKGGVGKTTSCINISSGLALAGEKVLVIDGDPQGNLSNFYCDSETHYDLALAFDEIVKLKEKTSLDKCVVPGVRENLDIIPIFSRNLRTNISPVTMWESRDLFYDSFAELKKKYDWVLIDCSPSNGYLERTLLYVSQSVLVPLEFQYFSVKNLEQLFKDVNNMTFKAAKHINVDALIFTRVVKRLNRTKEYQKLFNEAFSTPIFTIARSESLVKSIEERRTIWEFDSKSRACTDYYDIIENLFLG